MTDTSRPISKYNSLYVIRLIKGDIPLVITFWLYLVAINALFKLLINFMLENSIQIEQSGYGFMFNLLPYVYWPYLVFIWVATWNSARKYKGRLWGTFAQVIVVLGALMSLASFSPSNQYIALRDNIRKMNEDLPYIVAPGVELTSISSDNDGAYFTYRLINDTVSNVDVPLVTERLHKSLIATGCHDEETIKMMKLLEKIHYIYLDQNKNIVTEVILTSKDCL